MLFRSGATGASVTITGTNFSSATAVYFGGVAATSFTVNSATSITAVVDTGSSGNVSVVNPDGVGAKAGFTYIPPAPTVATFTPSSTGQGVTVSITGTNFIDVTSVKFGGVNAASFTVFSPTSIGAVVGAGASGSVSVTTTGGTGSNGSANSVNGGNINVPAHCWKVIVVLPNGNNDINRVSSATRVIAVDMPNVQTVNSQTWGYYRTSVDAIEAATGYDFLSNISTSIQSSVESIVDNGPTQ